MGGLLAAEAATDPSNAPGAYPATKPRRIVGMIAFDCPYLGMHPHVVISGIASLFPKGDGKTEKELNHHPQVTIVDGDVTDNWEAFKKKENEHAHRTFQDSNPDLQSRSPDCFAHSPSSSSFSDDWEAFNRRPNGQSTAPSSSGSLSLPSSSSHSTSSSSSRSHLSFVDNALSFVSTHSNHPVVKWVRKNADHPFSEGKRWAVEHFQFGSCMFDPIGLKDRYTRLVVWQGVWVNYWTQTVPEGKGGAKADETRANQQVADNDVALLQTNILPSPDPSAAAQTLNGSREQREAYVKSEEKRSKARPGHHFVVLPTGFGEVLGGAKKWEKVLIEGAEDEVAAHCGLFIRDRNLDYDGLLERVGRRIFGWCEGL